MSNFYLFYSSEFLTWSCLIRVFFCTSGRWNRRQWSMTMQKLVDKHVVLWAKWKWGIAFHCEIRLSQSLVKKKHWLENSGSLDSTALFISDKTFNIFIAMVTLSTFSVMISCSDRSGSQTRLEPLPPCLHSYPTWPYYSRSFWVSLHKRG